MNDSIDMPENLTPWGLSSTHFDNMVPNRNILCLQKLGLKNVADRALDMQATYTNLMQQMLRDKDCDRKSKTAQLAKRAERDLKLLSHIFDKSIKSNQKIGHRIHDKVQPVHDTSRLKEIRQILDGRDKFEIMKLASSNPEVLLAIMAGPIPQVAHGFSDEQMEKLNDEYAVKMIGDEFGELLNSDTAAKVLLELKDSIYTTLKAVIEADKGEQ
jgi:hypothetical protein